MCVKSIVAALLGAFVLVAVLIVARQSTAPQQDSPAAPGAPVAAAAVVPVPTVTVPTVPATAAPAPAVETNQAPAPPVERPVAPAPPKRTAAPARVTAAEAPKHKVVAMYFHGDVRCTTCRKVEAYAREAIEEGFKDQVASGVVEFRAVNVDREENKHFIQDYQLMNKSVVVADEVGGSVTRWVKLDNVWGLVGNRDAYLLYVQDAVRGYVENP